MITWKEGQCAALCPLLQSVTRRSLLGDVPTRGVTCAQDSRDLLHMHGLVRSRDDQGIPWKPRARHSPYRDDDPALTVTRVAELATHPNLRGSAKILAEEECVPRTRMSDDPDLEVERRDCHLLALFFWSCRALSMWCWRTGVFRAAKGAERQVPRAPSSPACRSVNIRAVKGGDQSTPLSTTRSSEGLFLWAQWVFCVCVFELFLSATHAEPNMAVAGPVLQGVRVSATLRHPLSGPRRATPPRQALRAGESGLVVVSGGGRWCW